jgi:hypothetical protein
VDAALDEIRESACIGGEKLKQAEKKGNPSRGNGGGAFEASGYSLIAISDFNRFGNYVVQIPYIALGLAFIHDTLFI